MATAAPVSSATTPQSTLPTPHGSTLGARQWRITIWDRSYAREMLLPMSIGLILLILVLAGNFVYWAINSIVNQGMSMVPIFRLFILAAPGFAVQGIPVGVILAVCLVLNRAVRDNEIIALRVGGASMPRILAPFFVMALLASFFSWWMVENVTPRTNSMVTKSLEKMMSVSAAPLIEGDKYFRVGKYFFYVQSVNGKVLQNVMIYERGSGNLMAFAPTHFPLAYIARRAFEDPKRPNRWILENVITHAYDEQGRQKIEWPSKQIKIDVGRELSTYWAEQKDPFAMTSNELSQQIEDLESSAFDQNELQKRRVAYYRRFAIPFASFVMALLAAPLSLRFARHGSFAGLVCAFALAFFWQGFDSWFRALAMGGYVTPINAAWGTNAIFFCAGVLLLWRER